LQRCLSIIDIPTVSAPPAICGHPALSSCAEPEVAIEIISSSLPLGLQIDARFKTEPMMMRKR